MPGRVSVDDRAGNLCYKVPALAHRTSSIQALFDAPAPHHANHWLKEVYQDICKIPRQAISPDSPGQLSRTLCLRGRGGISHLWQDARSGGTGRSRGTPATPPRHRPVPAVRREDLFMERPVGGGSGSVPSKRIGGSFGARLGGSISAPMNEQKGPIDSTGTS